MILSLEVKEEVMGPEEIKSLRARLGWTQRELADYLGLTPCQVSHLEVGRTKATGPKGRMLRLLEAIEKKVAGEKS